MDATRVGGCGGRRVRGSRIDLYAVLFDQADIGMRVLQHHAGAAPLELWLLVLCIRLRCIACGGLTERLTEQAQVDV